MEQNPLREVNNFLYSQDVSSILWKGIVHCLAYSSTLAPILSQINPVSVFPASFFKTYFNILSNCIILSAIPTKPQSAFLSFCLYHMPCPSYSPRCDHLKCDRRGIPVLHFNTVKLYPLFCTLHSLSHKYLLSFEFSNAFSLCSEY